jgi:NADH:ubiquinone oxidoreductase subunit 5 (subunit L)/multisubunit Na+/H+ antiporter MnhA subunit
MRLFFDTAAVVGLCAPFLASAFAATRALSTTAGEAQEASTARAVRMGAWTALLAAAVGIIGQGVVGERAMVVGRWLAVDGYKVDVALQLDRIGAVAWLVVGLLGVAAARFSTDYLHREPGYHRYFALFSLFLGGASLVATAGNLVLLFGGWELLGLTSALLIGFFFERRAPVENGFRAFSTNRIGDGAFLFGIAMVVVQGGSIALEGLGKAVPGWSPAQLALCAVPFVVAAAAKSGQLPFSGWFWRSVEGPTPSSAVFYGAIVAHAGVFLLIRLFPLIGPSAAASGLVLLTGAATAVAATWVTAAQTDAKGILAWATLAQVGLMFVTLGLGYPELAGVHAALHAAWRMSQFLEAPSAIVEVRAALRAPHRLEGSTPMSPGWFVAPGLALGLIAAAELGWLPAAFGVPQVLVATSVLAGLDLGARIVSQAFGERLTGGIRRSLVVHVIAWVGFAAVYAAVSGLWASTRVTPFGAIVVAGVLFMGWFGTQLLDRQRSERLDGAGFEARRLYGLALHRLYLDPLSDRLLAQPLLRFGAALDLFDRRVLEPMTGLVAPAIQTREAIGPPSSSPSTSSSQGAWRRPVPRSGSTTTTSWIPTRPSWACRGCSRWWGSLMCSSSR